MTVEEKISTLVERYCRNRSHLADMIGTSPQTVNNWIYRDHIPARGIEAIIARFPEVNRDWLRGGSDSSSGPLPLPAEEEEDETPAYATARPRTSAMLVTGVHPSLGDGLQMESYEGMVPVQMPRRDIKFVFQCHGDSMLPRIQDGDFVGVGDPLGRYEDFKQGIPYLVQTTDGRLMVKMVMDPGPSSPHLVLSTENPNYQLADGGRLSKEEFRAAYRVIMVMRDL